MYKYSNGLNEMLAEIKVKREIMISCANKHGFTNEKTIKYSQELDELINQYQKFYTTPPRKNEAAKFAFHQITIVWPKALIEL